MKPLLLSLASLIILASCGTTAPPAAPQRQVTVATEPRVFVDALGTAIDCPARFDEQCRADGFISETEAGYSGVTLQRAPSTTEVPLFIVTERLPTASTTEVPEVGTLVELPVAAGERQYLTPRTWSFGPQGYVVEATAIRPSGRVRMRWGRLSYRSVFGTPHVTRIASYAPPANDSGPSSSTAGHQTYVGPRGGVYHYSASGKKVYEKRGGTSSRSRKK